VVYLQTREYTTISPTNPTDLSSVIIFFLCFPFVHLIISSYTKKKALRLWYSLCLSLSSLLFYQEKERKDLDIISSSWVKPLLVRIREGSVPNVADGFIGPNFSKRVPIT
jgi:phosphate starvation-inducible membrane PsiE